MTDWKRLLMTEETLGTAHPSPSFRPTCVLAPEGDPVWPSGTAQLSHSVLSCWWAVLRSPALLREELGGGWLRIGTWDGKRGA